MVLMIEVRTENGGGGVQKAIFHIFINQKFAFVANSFHQVYKCLLKISFADKYAKDSISSSSAKPQNREQTSSDASSSSTMSKGEKYEAKKSIVILIAIFVISLIAMFYVYLMFPELEA